MRSDRVLIVFFQRGIVLRVLRGGLLATAILLLVCETAALAAPKTDVIVMKNGDRFTGEVKGLDRGKLTLNTDAVGTLEIEWDLVARVISTQQLQIETFLGEVHFGSLVDSETAGKLRVKEREQTIDLPVLDIVRMAPIAQSKLKRLSGNVSAGYSLLTANEQRQGTFDLNLKYRTPNWLTQLSANDTQTSTINEPASTRAVAALQVLRLLEDRWFAGALLQGDHNNQLGIKLRISAGGGGGRYLVQTNSQLWSFLVGILATREQDYDTSAVTHSAEATLGTSFDWFRFRHPEIDLSSTVTVLPSLTESGRWRSTWNLALRWEIYKDFYWDIKFYGDYDNRAAAGGFAKSDYSLITALGWSF